MEKKFAEGVFLTQKTSKGGKSYLQLRLKQADGSYKNFVCFLSDKLDKFGNKYYSVMESDPAPVKANEDLPF